MSSSLAENEILFLVSDPCFLRAGVSTFQTIKMVLPVNELLGFHGGLKLNGPGMVWPGVAHHVTREGTS